MRLRGAGDRARSVCDARVLGAHDERGLDRGAEVRAVAEGGTRALAQGRATDVSDVEVPVKILAIDPGFTQSAIVEFDGRAIHQHRTLPNEQLLKELPCMVGVLVIEQIAAMGMAVGEEVFETVFWSGRFAQAFRGEYQRIKRHAIKMHLCGNTRAKDPNIRQALLDRFGPGREKAIGTKRTPGPLYGISGDQWAALAVAVTWWDQHIAKGRVA